MPQDAAGLAAFYDTVLGQRTRRLLSGRLRTFWPNLKGLRLLGFGYAIPYLGAFAEAERAIAALPAEMGVMAWPKGEEDRRGNLPRAHDSAQIVGEVVVAGSGASEDRRGNAVLSCAEDALPFADMLFDRILIVHGLEASESLRPLLRQIWRVLAPEGKVLLVAPNRASLWAQLPRSPFGYGRPFSKPELDGILRNALLVPGRWERALYAPPFLSLTGRGLSWERLGERTLPGMGGLHVVEATKSLYAAAAPGLPQAVQAATLKTARDF